MKTLKKRLSEGLARVYVVEGDDYYLFDKAFLMIKNACGITCLLYTSPSPRDA